MRTVIGGSILQELRRHAKIGRCLFMAVRTGKRDPEQLYFP
jgi:hypothetical protein